MDGGRQSVGLTALQHNITSVIVAIILFTGIYPQNALNKEVETFAKFPSSPSPPTAKTQTQVFRLFSCQISPFFSPDAP